MRNGRLFIGTVNKLVESAWPYPGLSLSVLYAFAGYPLALAPVIDDRNGHTPSIVVLNTVDCKLAGEIPLPADAASAPSFIIDPETDGAICLDQQCRYIVCVDFRSVVSQSAKSACKEYPHFDSQGRHGPKSTEERFGR